MTPRAEPTAPRRAPLDPRPDLGSAPAGLGSPGTDRPAPRLDPDRSRPGRRPGAGFHRDARDARAQADAREDQVRPDGAPCRP